MYCLFASVVLVVRPEGPRLPETTGRINQVCSGSQTPDEVKIHIKVMFMYN